MSEDNDVEKEHEATPHKLEQARKKGQIVRSTDISVAASYGGMLVAVAGVSGLVLPFLGTQLARMLGDADLMAPQMLGGGGVGMGKVLLAALGGIAPFVLLPMLAVLAGLTLQRAFLFTPEKLMPKFSRIDPLSNAKQKFGRGGLFEFAKSSIKLILLSLLLGYFLSGRVDGLLAAQRSEAGVAILYLGSLIRDFLAVVLAMAVLFAAIDYLWQYFEHLRRNRMSRQELIDEMKNAEGDPHMKGQRRQRAREVALSRMLADVPRADVVIVNPTHYAVALEWKRGSGRAPVCVAKGVDAMAARIREIASENAIPIRSDPPTARAIYATVEIGAEIHRDQYRAVAAAIRYAETIRGKARARRATL